MNEKNAALLQMDIGLLYIPRRTAHATIRSESSLFHVPPSFSSGTSPCKRLPRLMLNSAGEKGNVKFADTSRWCRRQILTSGTRLSKQKSELKLSCCLIFHGQARNFTQGEGVFLQVTPLFICLWQMFCVFWFGTMHTGWVKNKTHKTSTFKRIINGVQGMEGTMCNSLN